MAKDRISDSTWQKEGWHLNFYDDRSEERRAATDLPDVRRGKGSEYRFVSVLSFWYGVGL